MRLYGYRLMEYPLVNTDSLHTHTSILFTCLDTDMTCKFLLDCFVTMILLLVQQYGHYRQEIAPNDGHIGNTVEIGENEPNDGLLVVAIVRISPVDIEIILGYRI